MATMGKYCKAYPIQRFQEFYNWSENDQGYRKEETEAKSTDVGPEQVGRSFLYLQENYIVTDGIFIDEHIIFDNVTEEWVEFCRSTLKFEVPNYS
jgi:hypothetical protein